ncbi:G patch domain-containing protein 2-like [Phycodurus eques]|uniref:G patch domain-containing protein 2-like n=1 Tax=Phycodurus eques TaxID=693459 RepID=UPI002ACE8ECF|nr:G patch domain-containing protein 2-like [Phycodurus eques]XP_061552687.1 G patch domain-containing protein 2-like [Phycodurus eques]XP_061552688.1 G patch domain-containing protein 2-like [Phycodurus eques]
MIMMDELAQDLASALEQTSEQFKELWEKMLLSPLNRSRQVGQRGGRKRRSQSSVHPPKERPCRVEVSESGLEKAPQKCWRNTPSALIASVVDCSDSNDTAASDRSLIRRPNMSRLLSWPELDSSTENNLRQPLRRRRKAKRVTSHILFRLQQKLKVSGAEWELRLRLSRVQHPSTLKKRLNGRTDGGRLQWWKRKIPVESMERGDTTDEIMSESETSSTCNSDTGLFTNDEGRQGDDEQNNWFAEGRLAVLSLVARLLPATQSQFHR